MKAREAVLLVLPCDLSFVIFLFYINQPFNLYREKLLFFTRPYFF
jgi:hypothetical protein